MKKVYDNKLLAGIIIGIILASVISVGAAYLYNAREISYKPNDTRWNVNDIGEALDQLYSDSYANSCEDNVAEPNLGANNKLIPITLSDDGTVTYADINKEWYSYCNKQWANAVILIDEPSKEYQVGETISESDIESYFVWIPKYQYRLWNTGVASKKAHSIEIIFTTENTIDEEGVSCATPLVSGNLGNCNNGEWMTHPAFISMDVDGFWVGKFETGYKDAITMETAQIESNDSTKIIIKPEAYSWRSNTISNIFISSYNYERELDSHMMKNTEWGAVAILSHSKFGIDREVTINNNNSYITGYASLPDLNQGGDSGIIGATDEYTASYETSSGVLASTTGNITGVYDTSGGAWEAVAGYRDGFPLAGGFSYISVSEYNSKYFDVYSSSSTMTTYQYMILGDATAEMGAITSYQCSTNIRCYRNNWYRDAAEFVEYSYSWFLRGAHVGYGESAGPFEFGRWDGSKLSYVGSRVVLSP